MARALREREAELLRVKQKLGGKRIHEVFRSAVGLGRTPKLKQD